MDQDKAKAAVDAFRATMKPKATGPREEPETGKILTSCKRQDGTELRVALREYQGKPWVEVRLWQPEEGGRMAPTKKGLGIRTRELPDVVEALVAAMQELKPTA